MNKLTEVMMAEYATGKYTIAELAKLHSISTGNAYNILHKAGCEFIRKRRKPVSDQERANRSAAHKGWKMSEKQRQMISERKSCDYNGLNGYGHTKRHNLGYVLAYAPRHPHAHADGYVMLHTVIMERHIGRYLNENEVVHHINHQRDDNRIENLRLMTKKDHMKLHLDIRYGRGALPLTV